jgi:hypothetical protein
VPIGPGSGSSAAMTVAHQRHRTPQGISVNAKPAAGMVCEHRARAHPRSAALLACSGSRAVTVGVVGGQRPAQHGPGHRVPPLRWVGAGSTTSAQAGHGAPGGVGSIVTTIGSRCPQRAISTPIGWSSCSVTACARKSSGDSAQPGTAGFTGHRVGAGLGRGADVDPARRGGGWWLRRSPGVGGPGGQTSAVATTWCPHSARQRPPGTARAAASASSVTRWHRRSLAQVSGIADLTDPGGALTAEPR